MKNANARKLRALARALEMEIKIQAARNRLLAYSR
jgi:hypothetical protein